jgi:hypothetical protein
MALFVQPLVSRGDPARPALSFRNATYSRVRGILQFQVLLIYYIKIYLMNKNNL